MYRIDLFVARASFETREMLRYVWRACVCKYGCRKKIRFQSIVQFVLFILFHFSARLFYARLSDVVDGIVVGIAAAVAAAIAALFPIDSTRANK